MRHVTTFGLKRSGTVVLAGLLLGLLAGCGSREADTAGPTPSASTDQTAAQTNPLPASAVSSYLTIQEALAADQPEAARPAATALAADLRNSGVFEGASAAEAMARASDVAELRRHFETLSNVFISIASSAGVAEGVVYEVHCPMAFNNRGASWLQRDQTVNNPYYGARMLRCGDVTQTYTAN
jgi:membrane fusion protein, copper/silver efflux system